MERRAVKETMAAGRARALLWGAALVLTAFGMVLTAFGPLVPGSLSATVHDAFDREHSYSHSHGGVVHSHSHGSYAGHGHDDD
ncbi:MAG: hypothetical protein V3W31_09115 [Thermodesulfobacteriota bacterium]